MKVCFINSVYPNLYEVRSFYKEAITIQQAGYDLTIIANHTRNETVSGIKVLALPQPQNRISRIFRAFFGILGMAIRTNADLYHLHSIELLPVGIILRAMGRKVIYDAHEASSEKMYTKHYLPVFIRPLIAGLVKIAEKMSTIFFSKVIAADKEVAKQYDVKKTTVIANYPSLKVILDNKSKPENFNLQDKKILIYAGALNQDRGLFKMAEAVQFLEDLNVELVLIGNFDLPEDEEKIKTFKNITYIGFIPLTEVYRYMHHSTIGLSIFQPVPAYLYAGENTTKLFEYMACGLPIISSDFVNLKSIITQTESGICVDPTDPVAIADAIRLLLKDPALYQRMSAQGIKAASEKYNWEIESLKLLDIYKKLSQKH